MKRNGLAGFTTGTDTVVVLYGQDGTPIGFSLNDTVYTYIKNLQGDVIRILDTDGNTVVEYSYDPWGVSTINGVTFCFSSKPPQEVIDALNRLGVTVNWLQ